MNSHEDIIQAVVLGDKKAFQELYLAFHVKVYNTALGYVQNEGDAEEITQDDFVKIHQYAANFKGQSQLSTWIYRITVNTSLNFLKKKNRFAIFRFGKPDTNQPDFEHPGVLLENKEKSKILFKTIQSLPDNQKTAFILCYVEDLPQQEVADIMEISLKAVESLLQRAKKNLRKKLDFFAPTRRKNK